jgi:hypothetical protein
VKRRYQTENLKFFHQHDFLSYSLFFIKVNFEIIMLCDESFGLSWTKETRIGKTGILGSFRIAAPP